MTEGAMTVELWERSPDGPTPTEHRCTETLVNAVIISYGDQKVQVALDDERRTWEIEVFGKATIFTN